MTKSTIEQQLKQEIEEGSVINESSTSNTSPTPFNEEKMREEIELEIREKIAQEIQQRKKTRCARIKKWLKNISILSLLGAIIAVFSIPMFCNYTTRTRVGEGLVLASSAKNLVIDNAVNGFPLNEGWDASSFQPTENTTAIHVDAERGIILITADREKTNGIQLILIPLSDSINQPRLLTSGTVPNGLIIWHCYYLPLFHDKARLSHIPAECRKSAEEFVIPSVELIPRKSPYI